VGLLPAAGDSISPTASKFVLGPTQTPIQWKPRALSFGRKLLGREADHSLLSSGEDKKEGNCNPLPDMPSCCAREQLCI